MEKTYELVKSSVINYKMSSCCWIAPIRVGVFVIGYFFIFAALVSLVGTANDSFSPTIKKVQEVIMEEASTSMCILAYSTELSFSVVLVCAIHRNDVVLLRVYMYYAMVTVVTSLLVYSMVIAGIDLLIKIVIILSTLFQCYVILLVRSAIVEIKAGGVDPSDDVAKDVNDIKDSNETQDKIVPDVEAQPETKSEVTTETEKREQTKRLEKVEENPKEEV